MREWLEALEDAPDEDVLPVLAYAAGLEIDLGPDGPGAVRRAVLLLAAGGDPLRGLELDGRAVTALAADLDDAHRRGARAGGDAPLRAPAPGLPRAAAASARLPANHGGPWRAL